MTSLIFCKNSSKRWSIALLLWYNLAQEEFKQVPSKRCAHCTQLYFSNKIFEDLQLVLTKKYMYILHSQLDDQTVQPNCLSIHNGKIGLSKLKKLMRHSERISTGCAANAFFQAIYVRTVKMFESVWVKLARFCGFTQLYVKVVFFSAWDRSRDPGANWSKVEHWSKLEHLRSYRPNIYLLCILFLRFYAYQWKVSNEKS